jgi:hemoglobin-like flavoprotein
VDISESIQHIVNRDEIVTDLFYDIFLDRHPEVRHFFVNVNLNQQAVVLRMTLLLIEQYYRQENSALRHYLQLVGARHKERGIPSALFPNFRDCLLETLERFHGRDWNAGLKSQWSTAIDGACDAMRSGYAQG